MGIGTQNPSQKLEVVGFARLNNGSNDNLLEIGEGGSGNRNAEIRLIGDATRTGVNCGLKIIRTNGGANATLSLIHI